MTRMQPLHRAIGYGLLSLLLVLPFSRIHAQEPVLRFEPKLRFAHLDSDDGLVQNNVRAILQDRNGFMWFGTDAGLSRYDGYQFTTFQHDANNPNSLSHNAVQNLYEDRDGMIWIATEGGGINRLDPTTEIFTSYAGTITGDRHFAILQDSRGHLWFGGALAFGLTDFDPVTGSAITHFSDNDDPRGFHGLGAGDIVETADQQLWIAANPMIARYDLADGSFTNYELRKYKEGRLKALLIDHQGTLWVGGNRGLYKYDAASDSFENIDGIVGIEDILEVGSGQIWLATTEGLYRLDPQTQEILGLDRPYAGVADSLHSESIHTLYQSRSGLIWVGGENGVDVYDPHLAQFAYYPHSVPGMPAGLTAGEMEAVYVADDHTAWIGVDSVLHRIDLDSGSIRLYRLEDYGLGDQDITAIFQDHAGVLWLGLRGTQRRLLRFDPETEVFDEDLPLVQTPSQDQRLGPPPAENPAVVAFCEDSENRLWVAFDFGGLFRVDESRETFVHYDAPSSDMPPDGSLPPGVGIYPPVTNMQADRAGHLWLSDLNGFYRFDPTSETYQRFRLITSEGSDTWTEASLEDRDGMIWVASRDGLLHLDPQTGDVRNFTVADGLPTNFLVGILQDANGDLWMSSKKGLSRFTPSTETFRNYDRFDGLQGSEFSSRAFAEAADGRMFFGGTNGLTVFDPLTIADSDYQPPVILDDFELFNQPVRPEPDSPLSQPIWRTDSLTLDHTQNILSFEFAVLNYAFADRNLYRYRLEGFEDHWNQTDSSRRFATYTNLPAGQYTFRVQAANRDGIWSSHEVTLALTMLPPWWETQWFRLLALFAAVGLVLGGYQWRVRAIARHNRELQIEVDKQTQTLKIRTNELQASEMQLRQAKDAAEAANRAKSTFLANMSHELRSPLNAILGFAQVSTRSSSLSADVKANLEIILHSGEHLLALINQVLDLSKVEAGQMTLEVVDFDLYDMLDDLEDMFILAAEDKGLALHFEHSDDLPRYVSADGTKLRQTLINLIGNALKFTSSGGITVRVRKAHISGPSEIRLRFEVEDTGPGIPAEDIPHLFDAFSQVVTAQKIHQEGTGLGLTISRKLVQLMGGDITVRSELDQGTTFAFEIGCTVALPMKVQSGPIMPPVIGLEAGQPRYRVLIVDDNWTNRQLLLKMLRPLGFEVREAEHGEEAVAVVPAFKPHLIWMDVFMPTMDGIEAASRIKAMPEGESAVIIALTAGVYDDQRAQAISLCCDDLLRKPFSVVDILEMMGKHLGIKYVYSDETSKSPTVRQTLLPSKEAGEVLRSLPLDLIAHLVEAVELGDVRMIAANIAQIRQYDTALADTLSRLVQRFEFEELLRVLKETT